MNLPADPTSPAAARRAVEEACADVVADLDVLLLCTSELVTNAVLHGDPPVRLEVEVSAPAVRVAVHDRGHETIAHKAELDADTQSGRGLAIVDALASRWGSEASTGGNTAWFEVPRDDGARFREDGG